MLNHYVRILAARPSTYFIKKLNFYFIFIFPYYLITKIIYYLYNLALKSAKRYLFSRLYFFIKNRVSDCSLLEHWTRVY